MKDESQLLYEKLKREAEHALNSHSRELAYQAYGKVCLAAELNAIDKEQFLDLNTILLRDGLNNPAAKLRLKEEIPFSAEELEQLKKPYEFEYRLLDRLRSDCDYYLQKDVQGETHLWTGSVEQHIRLMREIHYLLPVEPEGLAEEDIDRYERQMAIKKALGPGSSQNTAKHSIFRIRMHGEERRFLNISGLDAEGLCRAYANCSHPFVDMERYGAELEIGDDADLEQRKNLSFSLTFNEEEDRIRIFDGEHVEEMGLQDTVILKTDVAALSDEALCQRLAALSERLDTSCKLLSWFGDYVMWEPAVGVTRGQLEEAYQEMTGQIPRMQNPEACEPEPNREAAPKETEKMETQPITNEAWNTALYRKMFAEQDAYRNWLLTQPPEEILNHTYEYTVREDILLSLEYHDLTNARAEALLKSPSPLSDIFDIFESWETDHMDTVFEAVESRAKELLLQQGKEMAAEGFSDITEEIETGEAEMGMA